MAFELLKCKKASYKGKNLKVNVYFRNRAGIKATVCKEKQVYENENGDFILPLNLGNGIELIPLSRLISSYMFSVTTC